jgi:PHD/YefM family antitoxin component YafN of YafNO toxin-antitoxin module
MSINSSSNLAEKREEAVRLFVSSVQQPITIVNLGADVAKEIIKGADALLNYIEYGKTD